MSEEQITVTVHEINFTEKSVTILRTFRNKRQLDTANSIISKILGLRKEYDSFIERLEK